MTASARPEGDATASPAADERSSSGSKSTSRGRHLIGSGVQAVAAIQAGVRVLSGVGF